MLPQGYEELISLGFHIDKTENYLIFGEFKVYQSGFNCSIKFDEDRRDHAVDLKSFVNLKMFINYFKSKYQNVCQL